VSLNNESVYQGLSKDKKAQVGVTDVAMASVTNGSIVFSKEDRSDDYKVTLLMTCQ
jgi:hypothetical protein